MSSSDGRYHMVYNGEVYNFQELKKMLEEDGIVFRTTSDTEVVLYSFIKWGTDCLTKFNGMFAIAVWDSLKSELLLVRDRFGKKPLYYHIGKDFVSFASELTSLMEDTDIPRNISIESINCYLALGYILSPLSYYKDVYKVEPATYIILSSDGKILAKKRYWDYAKSFFVKTKEYPKDVSAHLLERLEKAVKRRLVSDVPVGAFLSGGIDSSAVVAIMAKYVSHDLHTFSMGFDIKKYSELDDAKNAAQFIGTIHHEEICSSGETLMLDSISAFDEPFSDNSLIPMYEVAKLASKYVKVVLSGDGADELFAGYITYKADKLYSFFRYMPSFIKKLLRDSADFFPLGGKEKIGIRYKQKQFFNGIMHSPENAHYLWRQFFSPEERVKILGKAHQEIVYDTDPFLRFAAWYDMSKDMHWLDRHLFVDAMTWLPDDILVKVDRATMAHGLESRAPYLDHELAEYAASIPAELKLKGMKTKYILKKALKDILPASILNKSKSGFNAPIGSWIGYEGIDEFKAFNRYVYEKKVGNNAG
jgi:asparagine synthase (glutamine-hydrolysing)